MSLFGNLFGKKPEPQVQRESPEGPGAPAGFFPEGVDMSDWDQVFSACLGKMFTVQHAFLDMVRGEEGWYIDFEKGTLTLGKYEFRIQFLGSESYVSNSWLWGWENVNNFPDNVLGQVHIARTYGQAWGLEPLMYAQCELNDTFNGHNFSMVVCGALAEDRCYYRCPTGEGQGAAFVALCEAPGELFRPVDGITVNEALEYLLGENEKPRIFSNQPEAECFLLAQGMDAEALEHFYFVEVTEDEK